MLKTIGHAALFMAGVVFVDVNLHSIEPLPFWSWSRSKVNWVAEHGAEYDTLFLGSSRMHYGLRPDVFDARMAELGHPTSSFNSALSGMRMHDVVQMLDWVVDNRSPRLKRVVIELHSFDQAIRGHQWFSDQDLEMHAPGVFWMRVCSVLLSNNTWFDKMSQLHYVALHSVSNALRLGQGTRMLQDCLTRARGARLPDAYDVRDGGWQDVATVQLPHMVKEHEEFLTKPAQVEQQLQWKVLRKRIEVLEGGLNLDAVRSMASKLRNIGIEPVFVVMPTYSCDFNGRDGVAEIAREICVLELDDPMPNRRIYDWSFYYDPSHLNAAGSSIFSRYLADRIAAIETPVSDRARLEQAMPAAVPTLQARWKDGKREAIAVRVDGLPFVGEVFAVVSEAADGCQIDGVPVAFPLPPRIHQPMQREILYSAHAEVIASELPAGLPLIAQACVIVDGKLVLASEPVCLEPR